MNELLTMADFETFGAWVRYRRKRYGLTHDELGARVGLSGDQVKRIEERNERADQPAVRKRIYDVTEAEERRRTTGS